VWPNQEESDGQGMCHLWETGEVYTLFWYGDPKEREQFNIPSEDGRIILTKIFKSGMGRMTWIDLAQSRKRWRAVVNAVINLLVP
jgi:hypothetical protein